MCGGEGLYEACTQPCSNSYTDAAVEALLGGPLTQVINPTNV